MSQPWTADAMPDQSGKTILVTGANSGLGLETARELARKGAHVLLGCRNAAKAAAAVEHIRAAAPQASLEVVAVDLSSLDSIRRCAATVRERHHQLHVLCNNAGIMAIPYARTADGFEMQIGTNHLGHFALTGLLLDLLLATPQSRIVNVSSGAHRIGRMQFEDLHWQRRYSKWRAYGQSKLANLLFTYELHRRLAARGADTISVACHPGYADTNLQAVGPQLAGSSFMARIMDIGNRMLAQSALMGALPNLYAATAPDVVGGDFIGPDGPGQNWGYPKKVTSNRRSHDRSDADRLWRISEQQTGVSFGL